jgi:hypothetical protein
MNVFLALMVIAGGLFAGGATTFAWSRVPIWRRMQTTEYVRDFGQTINRTDKVQPMLLVVAAASAVAFGLTSTGLAQVLAFVGAGGLIAVLVASLAILVPLQRRIVRVGMGDPRADLGDMHRRWDQGNLGRAFLSLFAFAALAAAASV